MPDCVSLNSHYQKRKHTARGSHRRQRTTDIAVHWYKPTAHAPANITTTSIQEESLTATRLNYKREGRIQRVLVDLDHPSTHWTNARAWFQYPHGTGERLSFTAQCHRENPWAKVGPTYLSNPPTRKKCEPSHTKIHTTTHARHTRPSGTDR